MTNNDTLRRLSYALRISDRQMTAIFSKAGRKTSIEEVVSWLNQDEAPGYVPLTDLDLCYFLDGLILEKRGPRPDGSRPEPAAELSNNEVLRKLRIALSLQSDGMIAVFEQAGFRMSSAELGSYFRKADHIKFRECPEQVLRKFIQGLSR